MRIRINPVWDLETLRIISDDGQYDYDGPFADFKGGTGQAQQNINTGNALVCGGQIGGGGT